MCAPLIIAYVILSNGKQTREFSVFAEVNNHILMVDHQATAYLPRRGSAPPEITPDFASYMITVGDEPVPQADWIFSLWPRELSCLITSAGILDSTLSKPGRNS